MRSISESPPLFCSSFRPALIAAVVAVLLGGGLEGARAQNVFTVDTTGDGADATVGDGTCGDGSGNCSLRAAIEEANATANSGGPDKIEFDIPGGGPHVIEPTRALPTITDPVFIDGSSEPDYDRSPVVVLDGRSAGADANGLTLSSVSEGNVEELSIIGFDGNGLLLDGTDGLFVGRNYIGVAADSSAAGNGANGIEITNGASSNDIEQNVISNQSGRGIFIGIGGGADDNAIRDNLIGTDPTGTADMGNFFEGILTNGVTGTQIGTEPTEFVEPAGTVGDGNLISGNGRSGIAIVGGNATIKNNFVGTDASGSEALPNGQNGVDISSGASGVVVGGTGSTTLTAGGTASGEANVIAFNGGSGIAVDGSGSTKNEILGNRIFANMDRGIDLAVDGQTANDGGDADDGPNRLQNFPEIQNADYDTGADEVSVTYLVPSDPSASGSGASAYPLTIDFYKADADREEGKAYLGTDTYSASSPNDYGGCGSPPCPVTVTFTPRGEVSRSDHLLATATDANGNTSEFSAPPKQLPVELTSFKAQTAKRGVLLRWQTASEKNNAGFEIQHQSPQNKSWTALGFIESKAQGGTTSKPQSYRFASGDLTAGTHRFRLRQVDLDGSSTRTDPVTVSLRMQGALRLSAPAPSPVRSTGTLRFAVKEQAETRLTLYNVLGQKVRTLYRGTPPAGESQTVRLDASDLPSGTYVLRLKAGGQTRTRRLTVVR